MSKEKLSLADYQKAAKILNVDVPTIQAVMEVESGGRGFDKDDKVIIRFEPHLFSKRTKGIYDKTYPELSYPTWKPGYPTSLRQSWQFFNTASILNANAAVWSTSFGLTQILGSNYISCGCETLTEFVARMEESEGAQLELFCHLILDWGLDDELRNKQWAQFARIYNGAQFARNAYDIKLKNAYIKYLSKQK